MTLVLLNYAARTAFAGPMLMLSSCSDQSADPTMKVENDDRAGGISTATRVYTQKTGLKQSG